MRGHAELPKVIFLAHMSLPVDAEWIAEFNEVETRFPTMDQLAAYLASLQNGPSGRVSVLIDRGSVRGRLGFLGRKRDVMSCSCVEWDGAYASLIFHDEAWSEYRAIDHDCPVWPTDVERRKIAHGELTPPPQNECMDKVRAFTAIRDFLHIGARPGWLSYKYVS